VDISNPRGATTYGETNIADLIVCTTLPPLGGSLPSQLYKDT